MTDPPLSQIETPWTLLAKAGYLPASVDARQAQADFLHRYYPSVHGYLSSLVRNATAVDDLCQEFALRFIRGDFRHAHPGKGRFRDYLRTALFHLVDEHRGRAAAGAAREIAGALYRAADQSFDQQWRQEVLNQTWAAFAAECSGDRPTLYDVLRRKADAPDRSAAALAAELEAEFQRPMTAANLRQMLHRGRERFKDCLKRVVGDLAGDDRPEAIENELADLGLLVYVQPASA